MHTIRCSWSDEMLLGIPAIDEAHKALFERLGQVAASPDDQFGAGFFGLLAAFERDFREEEQWMEEIGLPGLRKHRAEHARVLNSLRHVSALVLQGELESGRDVVRQLPHWLLNHLASMDLMLVLGLEMAEHARRPPPHVFLRTQRVQLLNNGID